MGDFKAVLGLVFAACVAIVFIGASVLGGGGGNTPVSWVNDPLTPGTHTSEYYWKATIFDEAGETFTINDGSGMLAIAQMVAGTVVNIGATGHLCLVFDVGLTTGTVNISSWDSVEIPMDVPVGVTLNEPEE